MNLDQILKNSEDITLKEKEAARKKDAEKRREIERQVALLKNAPSEYVKLKGKMLTTSIIGYDSITFEDKGSSTNFDGHFFSESDFLPLFREYIEKENRDPTIGIAFEKKEGRDVIRWYRITNNIIIIDEPTSATSKVLVGVGVGVEGNVESDIDGTFYTGLVKNVEAHKKRLILATESKQKQFEDKARRAYIELKKLMAKASEKGENEISYNAFKYDDNNTPDSWDSSVSYYFDLHKKWLYEESDDIVVWYRRTSSLLDMSGTYYNFGWRRKYWYEKMVSSLYRTISSYF